MFEKMKKFFKIISYFGSVTLRDGTEVTIDGDTEVGAKVTIVVEGTDEPMALPDGEYTLEDGTMMIVADGIITDLVEEVAEEDAPVEDAPETEEEVEAAAEDIESVEDAPVEDVVEDIVDEVITTEAKMAELEARISELETKIGETTQMKSDFQTLKEKMEETDGALKVSKVKKEVEQSPSDKRYEALKSRIAS